MASKIARTLFVAAAVAAALANPMPLSAQPAPNATHIVGGTVAATFLAPREKLKEIRLPHASVFLVRPTDLNKPLGSALSDLSGRFLIKMEAGGTFMLCAQAEGFKRVCPQKTFTLGSAPTYAYGTLALPAPTESTVSAIAYGTVSLQDGRTPRGFDPILDVNSYAMVDLNTKTGTVHKAYVNNFGEYIVPQIPIKEEFRLRAHIDKESAETGVVGPQALAELVARHAYEFDIVLLNAAPRLRAVSAMQNGKPVQIASPGSTVTIHAVSDDPNRDKLVYRWLLPDGKVVGPTDKSELDWTIPTQRGNYIVSVAIADERGGYARGGVTIIASTGGASFSGTVVDIAGKPIDGAQVDVNGRLINTNARGWFNYIIPISDKYVLNIRNPGVQAPNRPSHGTASAIYSAPVVDGRWVLRRADVTTVDPTTPIVLQQKRDERDCVGPTVSQLDWSAFLHPGVFQWQDGRGNVEALPDLGVANSKRVQNVMRMIARINSALVKPLSDATDVPGRTETTRVPCTPGIRVEIPANALIDPSTNRPPTGNVQVALSSVSLAASNQMPGDYTAQDQNGKFMSMESFGAGSIEIGAGASRYNLKAGEMATVTIPVDGTQLAGGASLPAKVPFLYYDERDGVWRPDGEADLVGSGSSAAYVKKVSHLSTLNSDILKTGESCVAVEVNQAQLPIPFDVEVVMQPSLANPGVIQLRTLHVDGPNNVIFNLPNDKDIVLTPIVQGALPDGSTGLKPAGVFVVNTGGPQTSLAKPPTPNADGSYYSEVNGQPAGPCASRVTLTNLDPVSLQSPDEFLQGLSFQASSVNEFGATVAAAIDSGVVNYYDNADPLGLRNSFNKFKLQNKFGQPPGLNELDVVAHYANGGDLGFGRDMHCRRNVGTDGQMDYACYVTNFGQPPANNPDQQDAEDVVTPGKTPDATVAMEFSRVELDDPNNFPDNQRAVKFFVYNTNQPDALPLHNADLDGHGARPVPQLCMICHGGSAASLPADVNNPTGPTKGAFPGKANATDAVNGRNDILNMHSNFLPFDLHFFKFPAAEPKTSVQVQAAFKSLNVDIVRGVAVANGVAGGAIVDVIDNSLYAGNSVSQLDDKVVPGWDNGNANSPQNRLYRDVFARGCRTCHTAQPFTGPSFQNKVDFDSQIGSIQELVCNRKIMPHAQRTNDLFWQSLGPNMAAYLQIYGQTQTPANWSPLPDFQCGQFFQGGGTAPSVFASQIYPVLAHNCITCHSQQGLANFSVGNIANTYSSLFNDSKDGLAKYIVANNPGASRLYKRITTGNQATPPFRMPQGGPDLVTTDTDVPPDNLPDATEINTWINAGATGP